MHFNYCIHLLVLALYWPTGNVASMKKAGQDLNIKKLLQTFSAFTFWGPPTAPQGAFRPTSCYGSYGYG
jgi:hypothetical protein